MSASARIKSVPSRQDATRWRRFLTEAPPLNDLMELRRLGHQKSVLRRRGKFPSGSIARGIDSRYF